MSKYGWRPDTPDIRDKFFMAEDFIYPLILPSKCELKTDFPNKPYDQGDLGSCTGQAIAKLIEFVRKKQNMEVWKPSPLFIYYNERMIEGTVQEDAGAELRNGFKVISSKGYCQEADWPYIVSKYRQRPSSKAYANALLNRAIKYSRVQQSLPQLKGCIASGHPFVCGISVYESFEDESVRRTGVVPMPTMNERLLGGHAVTLCGYDDDVSKFTGCNSWGENWGDGGYFQIPYDFLTNSNLSADFWTLFLTI